MCRFTFERSFRELNTHGHIDKSTDRVLLGTIRLNRVVGDIQ